LLEPRPGLAFATVGCIGFGHTTWSSVIHGAARPSDEPCFIGHDDADSAQSRPYGEATVLLSNVALKLLTSTVLTL
jgi:hypothetical protein